MRGVTQSRWDYVNVRGFGALPVAPALRLPGDDGPWGRWGMNQQESVAGPAGHSLLTAFPLLGGRERSDRVWIIQPKANCLMAQPPERVRR